MICWISATSIHGPGDVTDRLSGCKNFVFGPNSGVEAKSRDTSYGFTVDLDSAADLKRLFRRRDILPTGHADRCFVRGRGRWVHDL